MIILGIGLGLMQPVMTLAVQNAIPANRLGAGTGAVTYLRTLGSALGAAIMGAVVTNAAEINLSPRLAKIAKSGQLMSNLRAKTATLTNTQALQPLLTDRSLSDQVKTAAIKAAVAKASAKVPANAPNHDQLVAAIRVQVTQQFTSVFNEVLDAGRHALAAGIHQGFQLSVGLGVIIFVITLFLKDVPLRGAARVSLAEGSEAIVDASAAELASEPPVRTMTAMSSGKTPALRDFRAELSSWAPGDSRFGALRNNFGSATA
jgi:hypothetical protein